MKELGEGNYRDAWELYSQLALDSRNGGKNLASDFDQALSCLRNLQRQHEIDEFREQVTETHADDWRLLQQAAHSLIHGDHSGFIVAGEFSRGGQRGGGEWAHATERDRALALQLMDQARLLIAEEPDKNDVASFFSSFANHLMFSRSGNEAWRLQDLTDLAGPDGLPDYQVGYYGWGWSSSGKGAAVDENGDPVFFHVPDTWDAAANDGERWRWCLTMVVEYGPHNAAAMDWQFAQFLRNQFGVQTMRQWGIVLPRYDEGAGRGDDVDESGPYALHSLGENETISKLANGVKRLTLPDEFNFIRIYQRLADADAGYAEAALGQLAQIFADRQQYPRAAEHWGETIERFGDPNNSKQRQLDQIVANWGRFENSQTQDAGTGATVEYRFRNGSQLHLEAVEIHVDTLIEDIKKYLQSSPNQLDWNQMQIDNLGYRLVEQAQEKYLGEKVAEWDVELQPRPEHFDRRVTITTPLQQAGAYLVTARMDDGNLSRIILWVADTAIAKKQLDGKAFYFVADATTGEPVEGANVEFFGWRQEQIPNTRNRYRIITSNFAEFSDAEGRIVPDTELLDANFQWIAIARSEGGRFAHLGFSGVWYGRHHDHQYDQNKVFVITDRPVYRPDQNVQFKFWLRHAQYDLGNVSDFAGQQFTIKINDPQGTEVFSREYTSDEFGGVAGEYELPEDAALGNYSIFLQHYGGGAFRVEEYKKPEYSVTIEAPDEPVMLGEQITATIRADYYFGAPVTDATVSFKVHRTSKETQWYPYRQWDWLYGNGYWWFASDYPWYRGWSEWGCRAPYPVWWGWTPDPPELVIDQEVEIGPDGTVQVEIDTALARELHGDTDHEYRITAEVVDSSRRTIVGAGSVLVAREPFRVFGWTDRGYYRVDDTIHAEFQARTVDGSGIEGDGTLQLLKITYDDNGEPVENVAQEWDLGTDSDGQAKQEIKASEAGQYRLAYTVTDAEGHSIEGGYLFVIRGQDFDGSEFRFNDLELITDKSEYAPGESVQLMINTNRLNSTVVLFVRPVDGIYLPPEILHLEGKSVVHEIPVVQRDMPNFHVEAVTISRGEVHTVVKEVIVPPEQRVLDVAVEPSSEQYKPGEEATVRVKLTDIEGQPFAGSVVMSIYDRAVEYISGGSNVPGIRSHFWKWRRSHYPRTEHNLGRWSYNVLKSGEIGMGDLGVFGDLVAEFEHLAANEQRDGDAASNQRRGGQAFGGGGRPGEGADGDAAGGNGRGGHGDGCGRGVCG